MFNQKFYGTATVGEKGQIVIPVEARNAIELKVGDKLLVVSGPGSHGLFIMKPDMIKEFAKKMNDNFQKMQSLVEEDNLKTE